ncbi:MAG TPA: transposase [Anaerolineales bacterium]|nr:transposase [Anaerolineales bacterium]
MKFDPQKHHRRSIRLKGFDYSQAGAYFVTIVTWQRECLFGDVVDGEMNLNRHGYIVRDAWFDLRNHYRHVELGAFVIMPNHVHGIIVLTDDGRSRSSASGGTNSPTGRGESFTSGNTTLPDGLNSGAVPLQNKQTRPYVVKPKPRHDLPEIVRAFKSFSAKRINRLRRTDGIPVWQRNYYERIIRSEREMKNITKYIETNPSRWDNDDENPVKPNS